RTAVLLAFPAALLGLLATQQVHFARNALAMFPVISLFTAAGVMAVDGWVSRLASSAPWTRVVANPIVRGAFALGLPVLAVPPSHVVDLFHDRTDSPNVAQEWLTDTIAPDWTVVVPQQLDFDVRPLEARGFHVGMVDLLAAHTPTELDSELRQVKSPSIVLVPRW